MKRLPLFIGTAIALLATLVAFQVCLAWPSVEFHEEDGEVFDDWHICRTSPLGEDGFLQVKETIKETEIEVSFYPVIALESLGEYVDTAYELGEQFAEKYPDQVQRAEKIFEFARDNIRYTTDIDQFDIPEYAHNADEVANLLREKGTISADCEEYALLLAVMYQGAGYRSGLVLCPGHTATILHLPKYEKANMSFTLSGDPGWIWLEATAKTNPFGWFPKGQIEEPILGAEIFPDEHLPLYQPEPPVLDPIGDKAVNEGDKLHFTTSATDANDDPLTYSASNLPVGANFNPNTRTFSWTPDEAGIFSGIHFEVSDGTLTDSEDITITVHRINQPPVLNPIGNKAVNEGDKLRFTNSATDANDDPLIYSASNLPIGANFNPNTRTFAWTPDKAGIFSGIHFEVSDGTLTDSEDITITVKGVALPQEVPEKQEVPQKQEVPEEKEGSNLTIIFIIAGIVVFAIVAVIVLRKKPRRT
jgi:hypothetical protein